MGIHETKRTVEGYPTSRLDLPIYGEAVVVQI